MSSEALLGGPVAASEPVSAPVADPPAETALQRAGREAAERAARAAEGAAALADEPSSPEDDGSVLSAGELDDVGAEF